jgi:antitoxin FitA
MSNLSIKDVPEPWAEALRRRAARHHRSLQGELLAMVEVVVNAEKQALSESTLVAQNAIRKHREGVKSIEQIAIEIRKQFPKLVANAPRAVDIVRSERDAR